MYGYGIYLTKAVAGDPSPQPCDFVNWLTDENSPFQKDLFMNSGLLPGHPKVLDAVMPDKSPVKSLVDYGKTGMIYFGQ